MIKLVVSEKKFNLILFFRKSDVKILYFWLIMLILRCFGGCMVEIKD